MITCFSISAFSAEIEDEEIEELAFHEQLCEVDDSVICSELLEVKDVPKISWLLQVVLSNLDVNVNGSSTVRILSSYAKLRC